ncbi:MAG: hypothetical protein ACJ71Z_00860 [Aeromicrobium sp.]
MLTDEERIAVAGTYLDAIVSHDGNGVPFTPDCVRIENGLKTGFSGNHLRRSLNRGPQYRIIKATTDRSFTVDGDHVRADFTVVTKVRLGRRRLVASTRDDFVIPADDGRIHHIRVTFKPGWRREA